MDHGDRGGVSVASTLAVGFAASVVATVVAVGVRPRSGGAYYETAAIAAMRGYAGAQNIFHRTDYDGDGVLEYCAPSNAQHPDFTWLNKTVVDTWPIELIDSAFAAATSSKTPKYGYWYVDIPLDADGKPYDAKTGYALCALPARYNRTGLNTFIVDARGTIFQKDMAGNKPVTQFPDVSDPESGWIVCE